MQHTRISRSSTIAFQALASCGVSFKSKIRIEVIEMRKTIGCVLVVIALTVFAVAGSDTLLISFGGNTPPSGTSFGSFPNHPLTQGAVASTKYFGVTEQGSDSDDSNADSVFRYDGSMTLVTLDSGSHYNHISTNVVARTDKESVDNYDILIGADTYTGNGCGQIFQLTDQATPAYSDLYNFTGTGSPLASGCEPRGNLAYLDNTAGTYSFLPSDAFVFGTAWSGGTGSCSGGCGTVWQWDLTAHSMTVLYDFGSATGNSDGINPVSGVTLAVNGDSANSDMLLLGTTSGGGGSGSGACGTLWQYDLVVGGTSGFSALKLFDPASNGCNPQAAPIFDSTGALWGTTLNNGTCGTGCAASGTIWSYNSTANTLTVHHGFTGGSDGYNPASQLVDDTNVSPEELFGTTQNGGTNGTNCSGNGCGTVYRMKAASGGGWNYLQVYQFAGGTDGSMPLDSMFLDPSNNDVYILTNWGGSTAGSACAYGSSGCGAIVKIVP
jgi:hypothetical protein